MGIVKYHQLYMSVETTVIDLSGENRYDVDGITRELIDQGIKTREDFENLQDPDMFWAIVDRHELPA